MTASRILGAVALLAASPFIARLPAQQPGLPSVTALGTAASRALGTRYPLAEFQNPDYLAIRFLGPEERHILATSTPFFALTESALNQAPERVFDPRTENGGRLLDVHWYHLLRTRHIDQTLLDAVASGATQVVNLGAGLDTRAWRFQPQLRQVKVFEVDRPLTQEYKKRRLGAGLTMPDNLVMVGIDFNTDDLKETLTRAGYSAQAKTLFIWEGVIAYLTESAAAGTLRFVRENSSPGSSIVFTFGGPSGVGANTAAVGEPAIFNVRTFPDGGAVGFVKRSGLEVVTHEDYWQIAARLSRGLLGGPRLSRTAAECCFIIVARVPTR